MISGSVLGGFLIGLVQGFGGVDHGLCLLPLMGKNLRSSVLPGIVWGVSHALGVMGLCGLLFVLQFYGLKMVHVTADYIFGITLIVFGA